MQVWSQMRLTASSQRLAIFYSVHTRKNRRNKQAHMWCEEMSDRTSESNESLQNVHTIYPIIPRRRKILMVVADSSEGVARFCALISLLST